MSQPDGLPTVELSGMRLASVASQTLLDHVFAELGGGRGGWIVTANLDFLFRYRNDEATRQLYDAADIRVADGMPLVWAAALQGNPVPERVAGSTLVWLLAERATRERRSLYLLGGEPGAAAAARAELSRRFPGLDLRGHACPTIGAPPTTEEVASIVSELTMARPDILLAGFGSPKQEQLISALRPHFPLMWMMGVGVSFSFVAGSTARAPIWMQRAGLEWLHRLVHEPRRLARRYLVDDLPFSLVLLATSLRQRMIRAYGKPANRALSPTT